MGGQVCENRTFSNREAGGGGKRNRQLITEYISAPLIVALFVTMLERLAYHVFCGTATVIRDSFVSDIISAYQVALLGLRKLAGLAQQHCGVRIHFEYFCVFITAIAELYRN